MLYEIRSWLNGSVLFSLETESMRLCVEAAVSAEISLRDVDLRGADLCGADLSGADLRGAALRGADLSGAGLSGADLCGADLCGADLSGAGLRGADLSGADLSGAGLRGADLSGADIIDGGQDARGFRFWAWRDKDGAIAYRAGCHEWRDFSEALAYYGDGYPSTGDRDECASRLLLMQRIAEKRWPRESAKAVAA